MLEMLDGMYRTLKNRKATRMQQRASTYDLLQKLQRIQSVCSIYAPRVR